MDEKGIRVPPVIKIVSSFSLIKGVGIHINLGNSDKIYYMYNHWNSEQWSDFIYNHYVKSS